MPSYYCSAAANIIHSTPPPVSINIDVVEYEDQPGLVYLVLFAHDLYLLSDSNQNAVAAWLKKLLDVLNATPLMGKYTYDVSVEDPK
jgi:hypothetical protein